MQQHATTCNNNNNNNNNNSNNTYIVHHTAFHIRSACMVYNARCSTTIKSYHITSHTVPHHAHHISLHHALDNITKHPLYFTSHPNTSVTWHQMTLHCIAFKHIPSHCNASKHETHITSTHVTSHHITCHHIISHHITSQHINTHAITTLHYITPHHTTYITYINSNLHRSHQHTSHQHKFHRIHDTNHINSQHHIYRRALSIIHHVASHGIALQRITSKTIS
jgi:hypothetical protein